MAKLKYTIDDLYSSSILEAFNTPDFTGENTPSDVNTYTDGVSASAVGGGEFLGNTIVQDGYLSSSNFVSGTSGWILTPTSAELNVSTALLSLDIPDTTTANSFHVDSSGNVWWGAAAIGDATAKVLNTGAGTFSNITITGGSVATGTLNKAVQSFTSTLVFTSTDIDTISWAAAGQIKLTDGTTYTIDAGNTGNMAALTYIYLAPGTSTTVLQKSTTYSDAVGDGKILVAAAQNGTTKASVIPYGGPKPLVTGDNIVAGTILAANIAASTITANEIAATTITGAKIASMDLTAKTLTATQGTIGGWSMNATSLYTGTEDHSGYTANAGDMTLYSNGSDASIHAKNFYIDTAGNLYCTSATVSGALTTGASSTINGTYVDSLDVSKLNAGTITSKAITLAIAAGTGDSKIQAGKTDFNNTVAGFILGLDDSDSDRPKFYIGDATNYLNWTGTALNVKGAVNLSTGSTSDVTLSTLNADMGTITAGTVTGATIRTATSGTRFQMNTTAFQGINSAGAVIFEVVIAGGDAGDVIMGDDAAGSYAHWDNSAGTFRIYGSNLTPTFGDGSDGDVTIAAGTTTLTRDMYYNNLVVTGTLITDGYKILVKGTISGAGTIQGTTANNGTNAVGSTIGTGGAVPGSGPLKGVKGSDGGSNGAGAGGANGAAGTGGSFGNVGGLGGGGGSAGNPGGSGGTVGAIISAQTKILDRASAVGMIYLTSAGGVAIQSPCGSTGGGQGGGAGVGPVPGAGGGAGSSGGLIWVAAGIWAGTFTISSVGGNGGNGGDGASGGGAAGGGGGGAGGNGGSSFFIYSTKTWSGSYTLTGGTGGNGGLKHTGAGGTAYDGAAGANGNGGTSHEFNIFDLL